MTKNSAGKQANISRRNFLKTSAAVSLAALGSGAPRLYAAGSDKIRVGLVGCGGRGEHDTSNLLRVDDNVELVAMGDMFEDRVKRLAMNLAQKFPDKVKLTPDSCYFGLDAYKKVLAADIDMVMLIETPHFRSEHLRAAVEAGKHIFAEKPVAVDPAGVRRVIETGQMAEQKNLKIVCGTQMRRIAHLVAAMERIHDGQLGDIVSGQCVRIGDGLMNWGDKKRKPEWSDMDWQIRRWLFITWLSGDFICEQHIHNLDVINWAMGDHPVQCVGIGGRQVRTGPLYGNVYDHMAVEYEYPNGARIQYIGQQIDGCTDRNDQRLEGTKGSAYLDFGIANIKGENPWSYEKEVPNPELQQHKDHLAAIREDKPVNELKRVAESTLTTIMGRMSAYTGRALKWDWVMNASKLDLTPPGYGPNDAPELEVAMPGKTPLI
jgi:predicted dehydrogenase